MTSGCFQRSRGVFENKIQLTVDVVVNAKLCIFTSTSSEYIQSVDVDLLYFHINAELILLVEKWYFEGSLLMVDIQGYRKGFLSWTSVVWHICHENIFMDSVAPPLPGPNLILFGLLNDAKLPF